MFFSIRKNLAHGFACRLIPVLLLIILIFTPSPGEAARQKINPEKHTPPKSSSATVTPEEAANQNSVEASVSGLAFSHVLGKYLGIPYRRGGADASGMDCSGFVRRFLKEVFGLDLPHSSQAMSRYDALEPLSRGADYRPSDLLFFGKNKNSITHVGIYLGDGKFIHAATKKGVTISSVDERYWKSRLVSTKRITHLEDGHPALAGVPSGFGVDADDITRLAETRLQYEIIDDTLRAGVGGFHWAFTAASDALFPHHLMDPGQPSASWQWLQGWRAHLHLTPASWMRITPSISWVSGSDLDAGFAHERPVYALETAVFDPGSRWSFGVAAHCADFYPAGDILPARSQRQRQMDLSVGLDYRPAPGLGLSIGARFQSEPDEEAFMAGASFPTDLNDFHLRFSWDF